MCIFTICLISIKTSLSTTLWIINVAGMHSQCFKEIRFNYVAKKHRKYTFHTINLKTWVGIPHYTNACYNSDIWLFHMSSDKILSFKRLFLLSMQFLGWEALGKKIHSFHLKKTTRYCWIKMLTHLTVLYGIPQSVYYICIYAAILRHNEISEGGVLALKLHSLAHVD